MQQYEDAIQEERLSQWAEELGRRDVDPRAASGAAQGPATEAETSPDPFDAMLEEQQRALDPEPSRRHRVQCDMMARLRIAPQTTALACV